MTRKLNIWNTPLRSPTTEAQDYAEKLHSRRTGRIRPTENKKSPTENPPEPAKIEENPPKLPSSPIETEPMQEQSSDPSDHPAEPVVAPYRRPSVLSRRQRRRNAMSIAVSEEEEELLRQGASAEGMTFSAWARKCLFRAMKRKIPDRPDRS